MENKRNKTKKLIKPIAIIVAIILAVITLNFGLSKFVLHQDDSAEFTFNEYRILNQEITINPPTYTGEGVEVDITIGNLHFTPKQLENAGLTIQYKKTGDTEWTTYEGKFDVTDNTTITARFVGDHFEGPTTDLEIKNIVVAKITKNGETTYYRTLADAIAACPENAGDNQTKIEMLAKTTESVTIPDGKNIIIDLCGATITAKKEGTNENPATINENPAITVNGKLNLIDSEINEDGSLQGKGLVTSSIGAAVKVNDNGNFTLGTEDKTGNEPNINTEAPVIKGGAYGVEVAKDAIFNFYDGEISGKTNAINLNENNKPTVTKTPDTYIVDISKDETTGREIAILIKTYTISFESNDGTEVNEKIIVTNGKTYGALIEEKEGRPAGQFPTTERTGYDFAGWTKDGEIITPATIVETEEDHTLTAKWTAHTYTVAYNKNASTATGTIDNTECTYDVEITLPDVKDKIENPGYTFKGWSINPNANPDANANPDETQNSDANANQDETQNSDANANPDETQNSDANANPDETQNPDKIYQPGEKVKNLTAENGQTVTLYAIWKDETAPSDNAPTGPASGITTNSITVNFNQTDEGSGIKESTIEFQIGYDKNGNGKIDDDEWSAWKKSEDPTSPNTYTFKGITAEEGLIANTKYIIRTKAEDNDGNGPTISNATEITTDQINNGTITTYKGTDTTDTTKEITPETDPDNHDHPINSENITIKVEPSENATTTVTVTRARWNKNRNNKKSRWNSNSKSNRPRKQYNRNNSITRRHK